MPVVATLLSTAILLLTGSRPTQLLFHAAQERMIAQNLLEIGYIVSANGVSVQTSKIDAIKD